MSNRKLIGRVSATEKIRHLVTIFSFGFRMMLF